MDNLREYINKLRKDFALQSLTKATAAENPVVQFEIWFKEAMQAQIPELNSFALATVSSEGKPSNRIVYLRDFNTSGFVFYTNYKSRKATDIFSNPNVCMNFFWPQMERQIRIEGVAHKQSEHDSDMYFKSRPRESQIGAWASEQSTVIDNRNALEKLVEQYTLDFEGKEIPRPPFWGGFVIVPSSVEFWQGRPGRLHDRLLYIKEKNESWLIQRLSP